MGLFGQNSPFEADIEKATSEKNTSEPWNLIMDICDKITSNPKQSKECLRSILKRIGHPDPHVALQAITLLDACVKNCGKAFHLEVASRDFETEYKKLLAKVPPAVATRMRQIIKRWKDNEFKTDPQLGLIPSFYQKLKQEGHDFSEQKSPKPSAAQAAALKDPNVVTSQQEEEDIAKAIELSLKEVKSSPKKQSTTSSTSATYPSLYPSFTNTTGNATVSADANIEPRKVRALYDFEAAEENELTFFKGEIIHVLDDSDPNWWKGSNQRGQGLFPSNFVTADLSVEPDQLDINQQKTRKVQFEDEINSSQTSNKRDEKTDLLASELENLTIQPEINEEKIDRLLHLLHEANPEDPSKDTAEMLRLEEEVNQMGPLIDAELELVDRKHAQLTQLSSDLVDAINLYHTLMKEPPISSPAHMNYFSNPMMANMYHNPQQQPQPNMFPNVSQSMQPYQYGVQSMYQIPNATMSGNPSMPLSIMQQLPPTSISQMNSLPHMITNPHMQQNLSGGIYDNSNNNQVQQIQQNHPQMSTPNQQQQNNTVNYSNDQQSNISTASIMQPMQQYHQISSVSQPVPNTQSNPNTQTFIQNPPQQVSGLIAPQQQMLANTTIQHNNILQQNQQPQHPQLTGLQVHGNSTTQAGQQPGHLQNHMPMLNNSFQNQGNMLQHSNGIHNMHGAVGSPLNHINPNANSSMAPNPQFQFPPSQSTAIHTIPMQQIPISSPYAIGMTQPLNQNILVQNDAKANIPIYQPQLNS